MTLFVIFLVLITALMTYAIQRELRLAEERRRKAKVVISFRLAAEQMTQQMKLVQRAMSDCIIPMQTVSRELKKYREAHSDRFGVGSGGRTRH